VVGVLDVGNTPAGKPFIVMQYIEGATLTTQIPTGGMEFKRAAHILRQAGHGLAAAHDKGILHRDLKPDNIMLTRSSETEEHVKLIDFGIAAVANSEITSGLDASKIVGTLSYMAPEQAVGKETAASDIYSLGVIAFQVLTGQRPDVGPQGVAVKPRQIRPDIPESAEALILKALSFSPDKRPSEAREFSNQLARSLGLSFVVAPMSSGTPSSSRSNSANLEMAYILFMDIVEYSKLPMDLQSHRIQQLQDIVRSTADFQRAQQSGQIVSLPTGDGMALVFFQNPTAPVQCAMDVAQGLKSFPEIGVRMGVHTGPVYRIADINTNMNVAGGGINLAQRVMDCGDAGHILVSRMVADILSQLSDWAPALHDLGEAEVKHGVKVQITNFYTSEIGNSSIPQKMRTARAPRPKSEVHAATEGLGGAVDHRSAEAKRGRSFLVGGIAAIVVAVITLAVVMRQGINSHSSAAINAPSTAAPTVLPAAPPPRAPVESDAKVIAVREVSSPVAGPPQSAAAETPAITKPEPLRGNRGGFRPFKPGRGGQPALPRERLFNLTARSAALGREMKNLAPPPGAAGGRKRSEMLNVRHTLDSLLTSAKAALDTGDVQSANRFMNEAESHIQQAEAVLRRLSTAP
jgi:protein kinase-like protein/adenylate/guanylate cyclase family protein